MLENAKQESSNKKKAASDDEDMKDESDQGDQINVNTGELLEALEKE